MTERAITPPNRLKERASQAGGMSLEDMTKAGDQVVGESQLDYRAVAESDAHDLRALVDRLRKAPEEIHGDMQGVFRIAHDMKGQAATFGYPLITNVANSLCRFVENFDASHVAATDVGALCDLIGIHVDALRVLLKHDLKGQGGPIGEQLMRGLGDASQKILSRIGGSPAASPS